MPMTQMEMVKLLKSHGFVEVVGLYDLDNSFISMVHTDIEDYLDGQEMVKKTLTIPKWSNDLGNRLNLNFSKVLTKAIENIALR